MDPLRGRSHHRRDYDEYPVNFSHLIEQKGHIISYLKNVGSYGCLQLMRRCLLLGVLAIVDVHDAIHVRHHVLHTLASHHVGYACSSDSPISKTPQ